MLVLTRRLVEGLIIEDKVKITVEKTSKGQIKLGIEAPKEVVIAREGVRKMVCMVKKNEVLVTN